MTIRFPRISRHGMSCLFTLSAAVLTACGGGTPANPPDVFQPELTLVAGQIGGPGDLDGAGTDARFNSIGPMASDKAGNVYILDVTSRTVRKMSADGVVTTLAGRAGDADTGSVRQLVDGTGAQARFGYLRDIAVAPDGMIYVIDSPMRYAVVRRIAPDGTVTTMAGNPAAISAPDLPEIPAQDGNGPFAFFHSLTSIAVDAKGDIYGIDKTDIRRITPSGVVSTPLRLSATPQAVVGDTERIAADGAGNLYVQGVRAILKITPDWTLSTYLSAALDSSTGEYTQAFSALNNDAGYNVYFRESTAQQTRLWKIDSSSGRLAVLAEASDAPTSSSATPAMRSIEELTADSAGNVIAAAAYGSAIYRVAPTGAMSLLAGSVVVYGESDGAAQEATFNQPRAIAAGATGELYVLENTPLSVRKITPAGVVSTLGPREGEPAILDGVQQMAVRAQQKLAVDRAGNIFVSEASYIVMPRWGITPHSTIRKIAQDGTATTFSGPRGSETGYVDGPAGVARYFNPIGMATDVEHNIYVADSDNCVIRKIGPDGTASTFAGRRCSTAAERVIADGNATTARFAKPTEIAIDTSGNLYVLDLHDAANILSLRKISSDGSVVTIAGGAVGYMDGTGAQAQFSRGTSGIAMGPDGNLYVTDAENHALRKITPAGVASTVIRNGAGIRLGTAPSLYRPLGIAPIPPNALAVATPWSVLKLTIR